MIIASNSARSLPARAAARAASAKCRAASPYAASSRSTAPAEVSALESVAGSPSAAGRDQRCEERPRFRAAARGMERVDLRDPRDERLAERARRRRRIRARGGSWQRCRGGHRFGPRHALVPHRELRAQTCEPGVEARESGRPRLGLGGTRGAAAEAPGIRPVVEEASRRGAARRVTARFASGARPDVVDERHPIEAVVARRRRRR
jgi:hypothetical protein